MDSGIGLTYLMEEMEKQGRERPVNDKDVGVHYQQHLEGWRYGPRESLISTMKKFMSKANNFKEMKQEEVLHKHYEQYMTDMFRINAKGGRASKVLESIEIGDQDAALVLQDTTMETLRLENNYYIIITGTTEDTNIQGIQVHKYQPETQILELVHQVALSNQKLLCWTTFTNSWI